MKLFSGSTNKDFAKRVSNHLQCNLSPIKIEKFKDGEIRIIIEESVRQEDCFIIQPTCRNKTNSVNDSIMELLIIVDALKRGSAKSVNVVIPYFGYQRQDRKDYSRAPISSAVVARCLESQNINRVIVYDLHAGQISGFFSNNCPLDNLYVEQYFINYIEKYILKDINVKDLVIVSPDEGAVKTNNRVASKLCCSAATIFKNRNTDCVIDKMNLMGDVKDKNVIMLDDIIDTAGTACKAAEVLKENGAKNIYFMASHGLLSGNALEKIQNSEFSKVIITNTVPFTKEVFESSHIDIIDVSWLCSEAIRRVQEGSSLTVLYDSVDNYNMYNFNVEVIS
jgi:ribose-phosphate pyrophosphokinase